MNKKFILLGSLLILLAAAGYSTFPEKRAAQKINQSENTSTAPAGERTSIPDGSYAAVPEKSAVRWQGRKPLLQGYFDNGTLGIRSGNATIGDGKAKGGKIVFDMNAIRVTKTSAGSGERFLENHLKSDDFFAVATFPTAEFTVKDAAPDASTPFGYTIRGDLTIKGITHEMEIPVIAYMQNGIPHLEAEASFDRTKWNIRYGSGQFFKDLADNVIDDMITVSFSLIGTPVQ
ncbi:MAG: YceI family protein [Parcubacteria group bacterium Gr01-1014_33]|nr:MAG: YceI family protein [Parcubacteria group bacterium Gr01-1014_33]